MTHTSLTREELEPLFSYSDGVFYNKVHRNSHAPMGAVSGTLGEQGYVAIRIEGKDYRRGRLVWMWHNGDIPTDRHIDHINRDRSDDRIENLRVVTHQENQQNKNATGYTYYKKTGKYKARISVDLKEIYLGYFDTAGEAHSAYLKAKKELHIQEKV